MKTLKFNYLLGIGLLSIALVVGIFVAGCKKDNNKADLNNADVAVAQDAEAQDAVIDQVDQNTDNTMDKIEANDFSKEKAGLDCVTITVDPPDTMHFPKTITLAYNCLDTINGEKITQTGTITITVDTIPVHKKAPWRSHIKRTITFTNYTVATDSASFTINGTRTMFRKSASKKLYTDNTKLRLELVDTISANLTFAVNYGGVSKNITRIANKTRDAIMWFKKLAVWRSDFVNDTVIFKGTISGVNAKGDNYSRTTTDPIKVTFCPIWPFNPIISSGTIEFKVGTNDPYTISYSATGCKTIATLSRNGKTKIIERKLGKKFEIKW